MSLGLFVKLTMENKKRDRLYGTVDRDVRIDVTEDGNKNPQFRYLT
jgi:hypothetical protein